MFVWSVGSDIKTGPAWSALQSPGDLCPERFDEKLSHATRIKMSKKLIENVRKTDQNH